VHQQIPRLLSDRGTVGVRCDAEEVDAAGGVLHDQQNVEPMQQQGVDAEKSVARMPCAWAVRNCRQVGRCGGVRGRCRLASGSTTPCWVQSVAESGEVALDPSVPPGRVLRGQPQDQLAQLGCRGPAAGAAAGLGPMSPRSTRISAFFDRETTGQQSEPGHQLLEDQIEQS
jgi:hypothetical protein